MTEKEITATVLDDVRAQQKEDADRRQHVAIRQTTAPAPTDETTALIQMLERAATNPAVDVDKMKTLLDMRERIISNNERKAFNAAMAKAQGEMPIVIRNAKNTQTNSKYATLEALADAIQPTITKHGFGLSYGEDDCQKEGHYRVVCDVSHVDGGEKRYHADIPIDGAGLKGNANKTATHAFGSTISYGRRYLKLMIFDVATKDDDDGNRAGRAAPRITDEQHASLIDKISTTGANEAKFLDFLKVETLADLPAAKFTEAMDSLDIAHAERIKRKGPTHG